MADASSWRTLSDSRVQVTLRVVAAAAICIGDGLGIWLVGIGIWTYRARCQQRLVARIVGSGGAVYYDFQRQWDNRPSPSGVSDVPPWLLQLLGVDCFHSVTEVEVHDPAILPELGRLRRLKSLTSAHRLLTDESFAPVARLRGLKAIAVYPNTNGLTSVGDKTMETLSELPELELANVLGSQITLRGLEALARSTSLRSLQVVSYDESID